MGRYRYRVVAKISGSREPVSDYTYVHMSAGNALSQAQSFLRGEFDSSERFACEVCVERLVPMDFWPHETFNFVNYYRKPVKRIRPLRWILDWVKAPENAQTWSITDGTLAAYCKKCKTWLTDGCCEHVSSEALSPLLTLGRAVAAATAAERESCSDACSDALAGLMDVRPYFNEGSRERDLLEQHISQLEKAALN